MSTYHLCGNTEFGTYTGAVILVSPPPMAARKPRGVCVDVCLALEITGLWKEGIETTGCCCGHGPGYIGVTDEHIEKMKSLGYEVRLNPGDATREDSFQPKTRLP